MKIKMSPSDYELPKLPLLERILIYIPWLLNLLKDYLFRKPRFCWRCKRLRWFDVCEDCKRVYCPKCCDQSRREEDFGGVSIIIFSLICPYCKEEWYGD